MRLNLHDRVEVDFKEIPEKHRQCITGTVVGSKLRHACTALEQEVVQIQFDKNYIYSRYRLHSSGIREIEMPMHDPRITKLEGPTLQCKCKEPDSNMGICLVCGRPIHCYVYKR